MNGKIGNQTNSQDPQAVNSRVFVGNLNTFHCTKPDVEGIFQKYGRIAGISMHKGYAFIQFTNPFDARSACLGEDGRLLWDQTLDVNLVAEPKLINTGRKRQSLVKVGNESLKLQLESIYRNYYSQLGFPTPRLVPPIKRARFRGSNEASHKTPDTVNVPEKLQTLANGPTSGNDSLFLDLKAYSTPDILICGNCRETFNEITHLVEHKKTYCKLRFTCKCHTLNGYTSYSFEDKNASLLCSECKNSFKSAWDLMVHVQTKHLLNIYQVNNAPLDNNNADRFSVTEDEKEMRDQMTRETNAGTDIESCSSRSYSIDSNEDHISFSSSSSNNQHRHSDTKNLEKETLMDIVSEENHQADGKFSLLHTAKESCYTTPYICSNGESTLSHSAKTTSQGLMDVFQPEQHVVEASTQTPLQPLSM